jgi:hypothetical protein
MPKHSPDPARRTMLARTGSVTAAGLALAVFGPVAPAAATAEATPRQQPQPQAGKTRGYRESAHTRRYYELARF